MAQIKPEYNPPSLIDVTYYYNYNMYRWNVYESVEWEHRADQITQLIGVTEGKVLLTLLDGEEVDGLLDDALLCLI